MKTVEIDDLELPEGYVIEERDGKTFLRRTKPQTAPPQPPKSTDIVDDKHAKRIRELEAKLASGEENQGTLKKELNELREIVRKAGETKLPANPPKEKSCLEFIKDLLFPANEK